MESKEGRGMSRKYWTPVIVVSALLVALAGLSVGAVRSDELSVFPRNNSVVNYPAFPSAGGPYLMAATYWPDGGGPNPEIVLVFNEDLDAIPTADDFNATFDLSGASFGFDPDFNNVVRITGFTVGTDPEDFDPDDTETIGLSGPNVIAAGGIGNRQVTIIEIDRGPTMVRAELLNSLNTDPNDDTLLVVFDHDVKASTVAGTDFANIAEFASLDPTTPDIDVTVSGDTVKVFRDAGADDDFRMMRPGVTVVVVGSGSIQYDSDAVSNSRELFMVTANQGPILRAAYYNNKGGNPVTDDELWLVFDEPVDPNSIGGPLENHFVTGGWGVDTGTGTISSAFPGSYSAVLKVTNMAFTLPNTPPSDGDTITADGVGLDDYQDVTASVPGSPVLITVGPGIIRAFYDDKQTSSATDDELVIYLNETVANPADVDTSDFAKRGFVFGPDITVTVDEQAGLGRITFRGFAEVIPPGAQIKGNDDGTAIVGSSSNQPIDTYSWVLVEDESRPWQMQAVQDNNLTYDRWNGTAVVDSIFLGWDETGNTDDSNQYLLWVAKGDPASTVESIDWANNNIGGAIPIGNIADLLNQDNQIVILVDPDGDEPSVYPYIQSTSDGQDIATGDQLYFLLAPVDWSGNAQHVSQQGADALVFGAFVVGPVCPPRDWISDTSFPAEADSANWDHDVIHVVADSIPGLGTVYSVYGEAGAIACEADSVRIYLEHNGDLPSGNLFASGPVASDGSFGPIVLNPDGQPIMVGNQKASVLYIWAVNDGDLSQDPDGAGPLKAYATTSGYPGPDGQGGIPLDQDKPSIVLTDNKIKPFDPWNPFRIYNDQDYINIRLLASGLLDYNGDGVPDSTSNALLSIWADFTQVDMQEGDIANFGTPADSIWFVSLGADQIDNDGDWDEVADDVGLDGLPGTNDPGEDDDLPTFGDPFIDFNGNGVWDEGETFLDIVNASPDQQGIFNPGEPNLDCNDWDEFGWYEIRSTMAELNEQGDIRQGYPVVEPVTMQDGFQELFNLPVVLHLEDNGIGTTFDDSPPDPTADRSMEQFATFNGGDPKRRFILELDDVVPSVAEFSSLELGGDGGTEMMEPGDPTYHLGRFIDFTVKTPSDKDVFGLELQIWTPDDGWQPMATDFYNDGLFLDVGEDNAPGLAGYNEDAHLMPGMAGYDNTDYENDGVDNDEDGVVDEEGEGIDEQDPDVVDANQTSETDDGVAPKDGIHSENDYTDNDNDAFFVYDAYTGIIYWYNIDEKREQTVGSGIDDNFDDDFDGVTDEADENPEGENYDPKYDNDEDGIMGGQKVAIQVGPGTNMVLAREPGYAGPIYVDAAHVLGDRGLVGGAANNAPFYFNTTAYTEPIPDAFEVLTVSTHGGSTPWGDIPGYSGSEVDSSAAKEFEWSAIKGDDLDLELIVNLFGLTADGVSEYKLRAVARDQAGNADPDYSVPITFTVDLTAPTATIPGCGGSGDPPEDFADVDPDRPGIQIYDAGKHPGTYTLTADADSDTKQVTFQESRDGGATWVNIAIDTNAPFTAEWPSSGQMFVINNYPAANSDTVLFRALAEDQFGNVQDEATACILEVEVIDGTNPTTVMTKFAWDGGFDTDLTDGVTVPQDSTIDIYVDIEDNDVVVVDSAGVMVTVPLTWCGGLDMRPGDAGADDDGSGVVDGETVADTNGLPDKLGEWPGGNAHEPDGEWGTPGTDDYITNDVYKVVFEYREVPDGEWQQIGTITGTIITENGEPQTVDFTEPVKITWNTTDLPTGDYDVRAYSCDIEGNCDIDEAQITTVTIVAEGLRAYIQDIEDTTSPDTLYAIHYIHDYEIKEVAFQYYYDADGNGCWDDGGNWQTIQIVGDEAGEAKGDVVLYQGSGGTVYDVAGSAVMDLTPGLGPGGWYGYVDLDGDGYSSRDPVVEDVDGSGTYNAGDRVAIGDPNLGDELTYFDTGDDVLDYYVDLDGSGDLTDLDWILRHNKLVGDNSQVDLWTVNWDPTGLPDGQYLLRAVATDETNAVDDSTRSCTDPEPIPVTEFNWDTTPPTITLTKLVLPDGSEVPLTSMTPPFVAGSNDFVKLVAETNDTDVVEVLFEYRIPPTGTWTALDVNDDDDFFADIDGIVGFQATDNDASTLDDEIFNDLNGNFQYDGPDVDYVRWAGDNGVVDTPIGWPLLPLISEDPAGGNDQDGDGVTDEDGDADPEDTEAPFYVYIPLWQWNSILTTDVNVLLRATALDQAGLTGTDEASVIFGENNGPETDVIEVVTEDGLEVDVWPMFADSSDVSALSGETDTLNIFVTAEDATAIAYVELMYRLAVSNTECYDDLGLDERQWQSTGLIDDTYPYNFTWDISDLPDGIYEFYPMGVDENGNETTPPQSPWGFKKFEHLYEDFAYVSLPEPPPAAPDTVAEGDEYTIEAQLTDPSLEPTTAVVFFFAPRILGEVIDPATISPTAPHDAQLAHTVLNPGEGEAIVVTINGTEATYVPYDPTGTDKYTYTVMDDVIRFGARPDPTDEILVDYNFTVGGNGWLQVTEGDSWAPYTVEWSASDGGVPPRTDPDGTGTYDWSDADAYDLAAVAFFDVNGDGMFDACDYNETGAGSEPDYSMIASEGNYIVLEDQERPEVVVYGLDELDWSDTYPRMNYPGNPLFPSAAGNVESKLSGEETDVFIVASDGASGSGIASVELTITAEVNGVEEQSFTVPATLYDETQTYIDIPITFYPWDYYVTYPDSTRLDPDQIENVILAIDPPGGTVRLYEMTLQPDGTYRADGRFDIGTNTYSFVVDLVGDAQIEVEDARNDSDPWTLYTGESKLVVPNPPFWYVHIENRDPDTPLVENAVHRAVVTVTDNNGNVGTNLNANMPGETTPQGPIVFLWDPNPPVTTSIWASSDVAGPEMVSPIVYAEIHDQEGSPDIIEVKRVSFEYSPNGVDWIQFGRDIYPLDGWGWFFEPLKEPQADGYDNDGDGLWDEEDEATYTYPIRVVAYDDAMNSGFSDEQEPPVTMEILWDGTPPTAQIIAPSEGSIFQIGDVVHIAATASDDGPISYVQFQYKDGRHAWADENGNGRYDPGIDEVWIESDAYQDPPTWDESWDDPVWPGANGIWDTSDGDPGNWWFDIDNTPQDNGDDPWDAEAPYEVDWNTAGLWFSEGDTYVWLGAKAVDRAGNSYRAEILTIASDQTGAVAFIGWVNDETIGAGEVKAVSDAAAIYGTVLNPDATARVIVKYQPVGATDEPQIIGVYTAPFVEDPPGDATNDGTHFVVEWDTSTLPEGDYTVWAFAEDHDGNVDEDPLPITIRVDHTPPVVEYDVWPDGFVQTAEYVDDGVADHSSLVIAPDPFTGDVLFVVTTQDEDVTQMELQFRYATDPEGFWRTAGELIEGSPSGRFDYEPNLDFDGHHVWRYHVEDWADRVTADNGPAQFRVLATDEAGNTNALQTDVVDLTIDTMPPTIWDWEDDVPTDQVSVGDVVHFTISLQDATTDVAQARLEYRPTGGDWVIAGALDLEGYNIDTENSMWKGEIDWTAPMVYVDTAYEFRVRALDSAGNVAADLTDPSVPEDSYATIVVEDNVPPANTKMVWVAGDIGIIYDGTEPGGKSTLSQPTPQPNDEDDWIIDLNDNDKWDPGTDYVISEGATPGIQANAGDPFDAQYDDPTATWPRRMDESFLTAGQDTGKVARTVTVVARTWADDESIDMGIAYVTFLAVNVATGDTIIIGKDEVAPFFPLYTWHVIWNTLDVDDNNQRIFPDGLYLLGAYATDQEGNVEDINEIEWTPVWVDNTPPVATMDADPTTEEVETTATVERNSVFTLFARTESQSEDDGVTFYYKRSRDLNQEQTWRKIEATWDADYPNSDGNPDMTRPFSMDLDLSLTPDPIVDDQNPDELDPLVVGESYDFAAAGTDILNNMSSVLDAYAEGRHITLTIVDNIAPVACITALKRNLGDTQVIQNPDSVHAASIEYLEATNFENDLDIDHVDFLYRKAGSNENWSLIDATITEANETYHTWRIGPWDLRTLEHSTWYEVVSVATDDVGNSDWDEETNMPVGCQPIYIYVDYEAPEFTWYHPTTEATTICDYEPVDLDGDGTVDQRVLDVVIQVPPVEGNPEATNDVADVMWEWKKAGEPETEYRTTGFPEGWLHDDILNTYATTWLLWDSGSLGADLGTGLYDIRVTVTDVAGNVSVGYLNGLVYDAEPPEVHITNIVDASVDDPTQDDIDFGQTTDVTRGTSVKIYATADDDEVDLPRGKETKVTQIWFTVWHDADGDGVQDATEETRDLGTIQFDPSDQGDQTDVEAFVIWNTTGLPEGTYYLQAHALDECGNPASSSEVNVVITDQEPPTARIACFDPDLEPHGNDPKTYVDIYAVAESDPDIVDVLFQYDILGDEPDEGWVNIGIGEQMSEPDDYTTEVLWRVRIESSLFEEGTQLKMRALAKDSDGNRYGDEPGEPVPELTVEVVTLPDGTVTFMPVRLDPLEVESTFISAQPPYGYDELTFVVEARLRRQDQVPRLVLIGESASDQSTITAKVVTMTRSVDDPYLWRASVMYTEMLSNYCGTIHYCVSALDSTLMVDLTGETIGAYPVTEALGTNGTVSITAYNELGATAWIPGGNGTHGCLVMSPTYQPDLDHDEAMYVTPVDSTTYHIQLIDPDDMDAYFNEGYEAVVTISYSESAVARAQGGDLNENLITVRRWDTSGDLTGLTISDVTPMPEENKVSFRVSKLQVGAGLKPIFTLVVPNQEAPVVVTSFDPSSPYPGRSNWTDADPVITAYLREIGGQEVDWSSVEVLIDSLTVGYVLGQDSNGFITWAMGNGCLNLEEADNTGNLYRLVYRHSTLPEDWLTEGRHTLNIRFKPLYGPESWIELAGHGSPYEEFYVDRTPPFINFVGGFVQNPVLSNVAGYFNPLASDYQNMLTVWLYDEGSGVFIRPQRTEYIIDLDCDGVIDPEDLLSEVLPNPEAEGDCENPYDGSSTCFLPADFGFKYDLWLIDREDDQGDVDEIEERHLLHTGTAGELLAFMEPPLNAYNPATDTLKVRLPIVGDSIIKDGDIIEVTLYSHKTIEDLIPGDCGGTVDIHIGDDNYGDIRITTGPCKSDSLLTHVYHQGILDQARNVGEVFVEQRFIVDMTGPEVVFNMPPRVEPEAGIALDIMLDDEFAGVDQASVTVLDPDGNELEIADLAMENGHLTGKIEGPLPMGLYTVSVVAKDRLGNQTVVNRELRVESAILTLTQAYSYPNPFNPAEGNARIHFSLSKTAEVTIKVYDFAGDYVATLAAKEMLPGGTDHVIEWGGEADDGTDLANGAYICRITATDGARTEQANVKVVIWRE
jgi:hypothetical protein